jgi:hypothetical protein
MVETKEQKNQQRWYLIKRQHQMIRVGVCMHHWMLCQIPRCPQRLLRRVRSEQGAQGATTPLLWLLRAKQWRQSIPSHVTLLVSFSKASVSNIFLNFLK